MTRLLISIVAGIAGAALLLCGLAWDAWLHAADPTLAEREGIFSLTNPGHALLAAGITLVCGGLIGALHSAWGMAAQHGALARPALRHGSLAAASLASVAAVLLAVSASAAGHDHDAREAVHTHDHAAALAGSPPVVSLEPSGDDGAPHMHAAAAQFEESAGTPPSGETAGHTHVPDTAAGDGIPATQHPHNHPAPTADELACLRDLTAAAKALTARLADDRAAAAEGYREPPKTGATHFPNPAYHRDGATFDLARPETAVYRTLPDGTRQLAGVMYVAPAGEGPTPCGNATWWHTHPQCVDPATRTRAAAPPDGSCPEGTLLREGKAEMMHLWFVPRRGMAGAPRAKEPSR
jgi:hypothetical protein